MRTLSIINLKGGVAKTISSINIAYVLAVVFGYRVLLIDNDKQGNTSKLFGLYDYDEPSLAEVLTKKGFHINDAIQETLHDNLNILPSNMNLLVANKEILIDSSRPQQTRLKTALKYVENDYDFCIIDNAPDINMTVINALTASNDVMMPIKIDKFAFDGIEILLESIEDIYEYNPDLNFRGCFITQFQKNPVNRQGEEYLRSQSSYPLLNTVIRKTAKVDESTFASLPLYEYARYCTASKDYKTLVKEYLSMLNMC